MHECSALRCRQSTKQYGLSSNSYWFTYWFTHALVYAQVYEQRLWIVKQFILVYELVYAHTMTRMSLPVAFDSDCISASRYICQFQIPTTKSASSETRSVSTATSTITMRSEKTTQFFPPQLPAHLKLKAI